MRHLPTSPISAVIPDDWLHKSSLTILSNDGLANVIASTEPVDPDLDSSAYATTQGDLLKSEFRGYSELYCEPEPNAFQLGVGLIRQFEWNTDDGRVSQIQMYFAAGGTGITATATSRLSDFPRYERDLIAVLRSLSAADSGSLGAQT